MKNTYCELYDKIRLSESKREQIFYLLKERARTDAASADGEATIRKPEAARGRFKTKAIPIAAVTLALACTASILIAYYIKNSQSPPFEKPAEAIIYNSGLTITDAVNGNAICLDSARLTDRVTIDGEVYYSENGMFLVFTGSADIDLSETEFDESAVCVTCVLSDITQTIIFNFRTDLFELSYKDEISGGIALIFETDSESAEKVIAEINGGNNAEYAGIFVYLYGFRVYGDSTAYASVGYSFLFDEIIVE